MPLVPPLNQLHSSKGTELYQQCLIEAFKNFNYRSDITIYCQNNRRVQANKISLFFSSKLFSKIIGNNETKEFQDYDVLCPDFDPDSMAKVIELINTGSTQLSMGHETVYKGMIEIIQCLQINIQLNDIKLSKSATNNPAPIKVTLNNNSARLHGLPTMTQNIDNLVKPEITNTKDNTDKLGNIENTNSPSIGNDSAFFEMDEENKIDEKDSYTLPYSCQSCGKKFQLLIACQRHERKHIAIAKTKESTSIGELQQNYEEVCNEQDTADTTIPIETEELEKIDPYYFCPFCNETFKEFETFNMHFQTHSDCKNSSENQNDVSIRDETEFDQKYVILEPKINKASDQDAVYKVQLKRKNKGAIIKEKSFICPVCQSGKTTNGHLLTHMATNHCREEIDQHYDRNQRECRICGKRSNNYNHLVSHLVTTHQFLAQVLPESLMKKLHNAKRLGLQNRRMKPTLLMENKSERAVADFLDDVHNGQMEGFALEQRSNVSRSTLKEQQHKYGFTSKHKQNTSALLLKQDQIDFKKYQNMSRSALKQEKKMDEMNWSVNDYMPEFKLKQRKIKHKGKFSAYNMEMSGNGSQQFVKPSRRSKSKRIYKCPICQMVKTSYSHLKVHIARNHYRQQIQQFYDKNSTHCMICDSTFKNTSHLESHLINRHRILKEILSDELNQKLDEISSRKISRKEGKIQEDSNIVCCHLCGIKYTYEDYILHLGNDHFFEELKYEFEDNKCGQCSDSNGNASSLIVHLILDHIKSMAPEIIFELKNNSRYGKKKEAGAKNLKMSVLKNISHVDEYIGDIERDNDGMSEEEEEETLEEEESMNLTNEDDHQKVDKKRNRHPIGVLYKCHLCPQHYSRYLPILRHMASKHYQEELREMVRDTKLKCFECKKTFVSELGQLGHLLSKHKALKSIIPDKNQLLIGFVH